MPASEVLGVLEHWTPYLLVGFGWNILISITSMAIGTLLGAGLAFGRAGGRARLARFCGWLTHVTRNVPTFVFLFYLAYLLPFEVELAGRVIAFPSWIKASLALSIAVVGFVSDNLLAAILEWRRGNRPASYLFIPSWTMYLVIIVMASSTASVIGVPEIVSRCNTVISATGVDAIMIWVYLYAMLWFFLFCYPLSLLINHIKVRMMRRSAASPVTA